MAYHNMASSSKRPQHFNQTGGEERNGFNHPQFGPGTQLMDERWEKEVNMKLEEFRAGENSELQFPPMPSNMRKRIHELAKRKGLQSKSSNTEPYRYCVISRRRPINMITNGTAQETQGVELTDSQKRIIEGFLQKMPIADDEIVEHINAKKSAKDYRSGSQNQQNENTPLIPPPSNTAEFMSFRSSLPVWNHREEIIDTISRNEVIIITGGTGCGKTTQVPQYLLEEYLRLKRPARIICTQPRRLPAIAVAERVAKERGEHLGDTVGYHIRLEQRTSDKTILTYCTSGVLLRMLSRGDQWCGATHVILDEVHEREKNTDYLLITLREALKQNFGFKVILMSATLEGNLELFMNYFKGFRIQHVQVPSRLFEVKRFHLGEVLALTNYTPPPSMFSGFGGQWIDNTTQRSGSFSAMNNFVVPSTSFHPAIHSVQTAPNLQNLPRDINAIDGLSKALARYQVDPYPNNAPASAEPSFYLNSDTQRADVEDQPLTDDEDPGLSREGNPQASDYSANIQQDYNYVNGQNDPHGWQHSHSFTDMHQYEMQNSYQPSWGDQYQQEYTNPIPATTGYFPEPGNLHYNPNNYLMQGPSGYDRQEHGTFACGDEGRSYARQMAQENEEHENFRRSKVLPSIHHTFTEQAVRELLSVRSSGRFSEDELVNLYNKYGGYNWQGQVDPDLCLHLIKFLIDSPVEGAILVFLPGFDDINFIKGRLDQLTEQGTHKFGHRLNVYCLHSQLQSWEQYRVFDRTPRGFRKVILSTNIAEASLTIDDVVFVIDSGKVKEKTYEHDTRISQLKVQWIAKSNAEQRSGRAGRCQPGYCFRLYSTTEYDIMTPTQVAELQRVAIHEVVLHAKMFAKEGTSVRDFVRNAPEPPRMESLDSSISFLQQLGALYINEEEQEQVNPAPNPRNWFGSSNQLKKQPEPTLTSLGSLIAVLPLEPQSARLLLFGAALKCLDPIINLVAVLSHRDPFVVLLGPQGDGREKLYEAKMEFSRRDFSDHLMLIRTLNEYLANSSQATSHTQRRWCQAKCLQGSTMKMVAGIRKQLLKELNRAGIYKQDNEAELNWNSNHWPMVRAAIVAGCYPGIGFVKLGNRLKKIRTSTDSNATLHATSSLKRQLNNRPNDPIKRFDDSGAEPHIEFIVFQELARNDAQGQLTVRTVTVVPPLTMLLFSGAIRLKKSAFDYFNICSASDNEIPEEKEDDERTFGTFADYSILELDDWLAIKGRHRQMRTILQFRFRIMAYFLRVMEKPEVLYTSEFDALLFALRDCLEEDHQRHGLNRVTDLQKWDMPDRSKVPEKCLRTGSEHSLKPGKSRSNSYMSHPNTSKGSSREKNLDGRYVKNRQQGRSDEPNYYAWVEDAQQPTDKDPEHYIDRHSSYYGNGRNDESQYDARNSSQNQRHKADMPRASGNDSYHNGQNYGDKAGKGKFVASNDVRTLQKRGENFAYSQRKYEYSPRQQSGGRTQGFSKGYYGSSSSNENYQHNQRNRSYRSDKYQDYNEIPPQDPEPSSARWKHENHYDNCLPEAEEEHYRRDATSIPHLDDPAKEYIPDEEEEYPSQQYPQQDRSHNEKGRTLTWENSSIKKNKPNNQQYSTRDREEPGRNRRNNGGRSRGRARGRSDGYNNGSSYN